MNCICTCTHRYYKNYFTIFVTLQTTLCHCSLYRLAISVYTPAQVVMTLFVLVAIVAQIVVFPPAVRLIKSCHTMHVCNPENYISQGDYYWKDSYWQQTSVQSRFVYMYMYISTNRMTHPLFF